MPTTRRAKTSFDTARELALKLPGVTEGFSYGTPSFRAGSRFLARLKEDGDSLVVRIPFEDRERLLKEQPEVFYLTDHYVNYPAVLLRLSKISRRDLGDVLERAWQRLAPKPRPRTKPKARGLRKS